MIYSTHELTGIRGTGKIVKKNPNLFPTGVIEHGNNPIPGPAYQRVAAIGKGTIAMSGSSVKMNATRNPFTSGRTAHVKGT